MGVACSKTQSCQQILLSQQDARKGRDEQFIVSSGRCIMASGAEWTSLDPEAAEDTILEDLGTYVGYMTMQGVDWGLWLCKRGHDFYDADEYTSHIYHVGGLPSSADTDLFEDDFIEDSGESVRRPGRGECLADEKLLSLFQELSPADLNQGTVADCWLISAFAACAEFPWTIMGLFEQKILAENGKYDIKLFHPIDNCWNTYSVDDRLPCEWGTLKYCKMTADAELWPCLIEKAAALMFGGYANLNNNTPLLALKALTGVPDHLLYDIAQTGNEDAWTCRRPTFWELPYGNGLEWTDWPDGAGPGYSARTMDEVHTMIAKFDKQNYIMCACSDFEGGDDTHTSTGNIVQSHAYTIIRVEDNVAASGFDLLQLRNPYGGKEWNGDWSDESSTWDEYPEVKAFLEPESADDGTFWISKEDFADEYCIVYVCAKDCGKDRVKLDSTYTKIHEASGNVQPELTEGGAPPLRKKRKKAVDQRKKEKAASSRNYGFVCKM